MTTRFVGGNDGSVMVLDEDGFHVLGKSYQWGDQSSECAMLAEHMLRWVLNDGIRANKLHRRFMHRVTKVFPKGKPWTQTDAEIVAVVEDIERVAKEEAKNVQRMGVEPPRGAVSAGSAFGDSKWGGTSNQRSNEPPTLKPNR